MIGLTADRLRQVLSYDSATGLFVWRVHLPWSRGHAGNIAGRPMTGGRAAGYIRIKIDGRDYLAHRLAWLYVHGVWPSLKLDHKNRNRGDNRFANLRQATDSQNAANRPHTKRNKTGYKGVSRYKDTDRYQAFIQVSRRNVWLGTFDTAEEAHAAYLDAARARFGEFARGSE
jgi:hypothetical protein